MPVELDRLFTDLDFEKLRLQRPSKFIFFCGGKISDSSNDASSMRHYLLRQRKIARRLKADVILAEAANQLYRDTDYHDLITFEEDIAKISAMVLVIAESAGSLAELGAFASNDITRQSLTIIMQEEFADAESFIRFGPVQRIKKDDDERVGFYPWKTNQKGNLIKGSAEPHVKAIVDFINAGLKRIPATFLYSSAPTIRDFIVVYWVIFLSLAIPLGKLTAFLATILPGETAATVRRKLYCMQLAGWIKVKPYSGTDYYYVTREEDPFKYAFKPGVVEKDTARRKSDVALSIKGELSLPKHVREVALKTRGGKAK